MSIPDVPYPGLIHPGESHPAVSEIKAAMSRYDPVLFSWRAGRAFDDVWNKRIEDAVDVFRKRKGLPAGNGYPLTVHEALRKSHRKGSTVEWAFDAYGIKVLEGQAISPEDKAIARLLGYATWCEQHYSIVDYAQIRPYRHTSPPPQASRRTLDCSSYFKELRAWAGLGPCDAYDYSSGYGNTVSLWYSDFGQKVGSLADGAPLDAVMYGRPWMTGSAAHVITLTDKVGGVWYGSSHGHRDSLGPSPARIRADYRTVVGIRRYPTLVD